MKLLIAVSFMFIVTVTADSDDAKTKYVQRLLTNTVPAAVANTPLRHLEQEQTFTANIATYAVKFEECRIVQTYNAELAANVTERFVAFRLCPDNDCSTCIYDSNEFVVDLDMYVQSTTEYFKDYEEAKCEACSVNCLTESTAPTDDGARRNRNLGKNKFYNIVSDCTVCVDECDKFENMEANGFIDATNFLECTMIYNPEDDNKTPLYAGPICASSGTKIKIGVFTDEDCLYLDETKEVDDYLFINGARMSLSNFLLKSTYIDTCISCKEPIEQNENAEGDVEEDADEVVEVCEQLYTEVAKCEVGSWIRRMLCRISLFIVNARSQ